MNQRMAVAVFQTDSVRGTVRASEVAGGLRLTAEFSALPTGQHGFHIHRAGDLSGEGCMGACEHYHRGHPCDHGGPPGPTKSQGKKQTRRHSRRKSEQRHTGDLGNIGLPPSGRPFRRTYFLAGVPVSDLWGRSLIVHADPDDYGRGEHEDSKTTGHSGKRIACAIFGRERGC